MASITNNSSRYGERHKIILKEAAKMSLAAKSLYTAFGYSPGKSVFSITLRLNNINEIVEYSSGKEVVYLKDDKNEILNIHKYTLRSGKKITSVSGLYLILQ